MRVVFLAAGAAGMYCGSCMHDNRLAATLRALGHDIVLLPLYTPLRTDERDVSRRRIFYGGINCYLQQATRLFRRTPWTLDRLFDTRVLLGAVGRFAGSTSPRHLADMTISVLRGPDGAQRKELDKLIAGLEHLRPDLVHLPNLLFVGVARALRDVLGVPVLCSLAGEDVFVDSMPEPQRGEVFALIRRHAQHLAGFVAVTDYYAVHATRHFGLPADRVHTIPMGIHTAGFAGPPQPPPAPFTIGYLAHVCPPKGLANLARALVRLWMQGRRCHVRAAGYLGPADRAYLDEIRRSLQPTSVPRDAFQYVGEVTRVEKLAFLRGLHAFSVPTVYAESKGFYVLEALAAGLPVVQPAHGSFPEIVERTRGGLLYPAGDTEALATNLTRLMDNATLRADLAKRGRAGVCAHYDVERMAAFAWELYERVAAGN